MRVSLHKIVLACSGQLGQSLLERLIGSGSLVSVLTDKKSEGIIEICRRQGVPCFVGNPRKNSPTDTIPFTGAELLLSVNYLFLLPPNIFTAFPLSLNLHGSLLPKYRGRTPHVWAIINGEQKCGVTVHEIVEECDAGDVLFQEEIPIETSDTGGSLLEKYRTIYFRLVDKVLNTGLPELRAFKKTQKHDEATYFGPRTADSGLIDWSWQRQRIRNWVRAQTSPYPGAFTFLDGVRIKILWCEPSDMAFHESMPNGLVVSTSAAEFFVKTPNGVVRVTKWSTEDQSMNIVVEGRILNG